MEQCKQLCQVLLLLHSCHLLSICGNCISLSPLDNELTVGKIYAALMIFDYYKQNRAKKLQQQQQSSAGPQVPSRNVGENVQIMQPCMDQQYLSWLSLAE